MNARSARGIAWILVAIYFILSGIGLFFMVVTNTTIGTFSILLFIVTIIVVGIWPVTGARINTRYAHPLAVPETPSWP